MSCIYLEVAESNTPARRLYESFGFLVIGRRQTTTAHQVPRLKRLSS